MPVSRRHFLASLLYCGLLYSERLLALPALAQAPSSLLTLFGKLPAAGKIRRVLSAGPVADLLLLALAVEKLPGFARLDLSKQADFIATPAIRALPVLGRLTGKGNTLSLERLLALNPDLIIDTGTVNDTYRSLAQRVASQTQIPYLLVDGKLADAPRQLMEVGELLGVSARAGALATLAQRFVQQAQDFACQQTQPLRFYSARGVRGLETGFSGSLHTEAIELLGLQNVASAPDRHGLTRVSPEQLLLWQPDVIITQDKQSWNAIRHDPLWQGLNAVAQHQVLLFSDLPFGWLDSPPGINRLAGLRRLQAHFDPQIRASLIPDLQAFFRLFTHSEISTAQCRRWLAEPTE